MTLSPCRPGHKLTLVNGIYTCDCADGGQYILTCHNEEVVLKDGTWVGPHLTSDPHLDVTLCPITYCQCRERGKSPSLCETVYTLGSDINEQCHPSRQGNGVLHSLTIKRQLFD